VHRAIIQFSFPFSIRLIFTCKRNCDVNDAPNQALETTMSEIDDKALVAANPFLLHFQQYGGRELSAVGHRGSKKSIRRQDGINNDADIER